jgi:hypothetical protein
MANSLISSGRDVWVRMALRREFQPRVREGGEGEVLA